MILDRRKNGNVQDGPATPARCHEGARAGRLPCWLAGVALTALLPGLAQAAGLGLYEMGTPDLGTAAAGRAALAKDAATVFGNPAGMTRLDRSQVLVGLQALYGDVRFDRDKGDTTYSGGNGGNAVGWAPGGGLYGVQSVTPDFKLGLWSGSYFGLSAEYESGWSGRYYGIKSELLTFGAGINAAYKVNDWLSVGGGPFALYGELNAKSALNNVDPRLADGEVQAEDSDAGFGGMAGIMVEPAQGTRFGVTYVSPVKLDFKNVLSSSGVGPGLEFLLDRRGLLGRKTDIDITVPQQVMLSGFHQLTPELAVMANLVWQDWSEFGQPSITVSGVTDGSVTENLNYDDTWGVALGAQYAVAPGWLWSVGAAYDTSPLRKSQRRPSLPLDAQYRIGTGLQHDLSENITVGIAYECMYAGQADMDVERGPLAGRLQGDYQSNYFHFINATLIWRF
jgi:long-chain fatty acid transport protein